MTPRQKQLLDYLAGYVKTNGSAPTFVEMQEHLGLKSKSGVHRIIEGLAERGFVRRHRHRARAIELVVRTCPHCGGVVA